jgi:hypothetical protein
MSRIWKLKMYKIRLRFESITDKDLKCILGEESEMLEKLADKLGKTKKEMLGIIVEA